MDERMNWVHDTYLFEFKKETKMGRIFDDEKLTMTDLMSSAKKLTVADVAHIEAMALAKERGFAPIPYDADLAVTAAKAIEEMSIKGQSRPFDLGLSKQLGRDSSATYKFEETESGTAERQRMHGEIASTPKDVLDQYCQKMASGQLKPSRHDDWSQEDASFHRVRQEMDCADRVYVMIRKSGISKEDLVLGLRVLGLARY